MSAAFPELVDADTLRQWALAGIDAARQAGASYADIRVADTRTFSMDQGPIELPSSTLKFGVSFGVRVCVDGVWGNAYGGDPTFDSVSAAARRAVTTARGLRQFVGARAPLLPIPAARGEWATPVHIDPFSISPDAHADMLGAYMEVAKRSPNTIIGLDRVTWTAETRVFASSEGSLVTQRLSRAIPYVWVDGSSIDSEESTSLPVPGFFPSSAGFEILMGTALQDHIKRLAEEAAQLARYPEGRADVGRYEGVFDAQTVAAILGTTLLPALEMDRVAGHEADINGTSFLAPLDAVLGQPLFSPLLQVTADRTLPGCNAVKWDDEGVVPESFSLIRSGRVVDYFTTRGTASLLRDWYARYHHPVTSRGSAVAWSPTSSPVGCASQVTMVHDATGPSLDTLIKSISNGVLIRGVRGALGQNGVSTDPQLGGGWFMPVMLYEVKRGQIVRRLRGAAVQFSTRRLFNAITTVGGSDTVQCVAHIPTISGTSTPTTVQISAPAIGLREVDVTEAERPN